MDGSPSTCSAGLHRWRENFELESLKGASLNGGSLEHQKHALLHILVSKPQFVVSSKGCPRKGACWGSYIGMLTFHFLENNIYTHCTPSVSKVEKQTWEGALLSTCTKLLPCAHDRSTALRKGKLEIIQASSVSVYHKYITTGTNLGIFLFFYPEFLSFLTDF